MTSQIRVDEITNRSGLGTVTIYDNGFEFTGVTTFTENVDITGGLTIGGVLTYEDTTNIDSVGLITARAGIRVTGDSIHVESSEDRLLYLKSTDANAYLTFEDTDSSSAFANRVGTVSDGLYFSTGGGGERVRIDASGRLLIGRTTQLASSAERLTIDSGMAMFRRSSTNAAAVYIRNEDSTADTRHPYLIFTDGSGNRGGFGIQNDSSSLWISGQNGIAFRTSGSAPSQEERLRITSDGKMGLGISSPARGGLHIHKASTAELHLTDDTTGSGSGDGFTLFSTSSSAGVWYRENAPLRFATYNIERVRISSGGNVGINETAPDRTLHVNSGATDTALKLESTDTEVSLELADNTGSSYIGGGGSYLNFYSGGNERLRIRSDGKISAGTNLNTTNTYEFSITGADGTGGFYAHGRNHYLSNRSNAYSSLTLKKANADSDAIDYLQLRDSSNALKGTITGAGNWKPISGGGIDFSATSDGSGTSTSELLDDYEEGTFTPGFGASSGNITYSNQWGKYVKIGSVVYIWFRMVATNDANSTLYYLTNLPFTISGISGQYPGPCISNFYNLNIGSNATVLGGYWRHNETRFRFHSNGNNTNQLSPTLTAGSSFEIRGEGFYPTV
jgi:hypothetical protein